MCYPRTVCHWVSDALVESGAVFKKFDPATGKQLALVQAADNDEPLLREALLLANESFKRWSKIHIKKRSKVLLNIARILKKWKSDISKIISQETGRSPGDSGGEVDSAVQFADFWAAEAEKSCGFLMRSALPNRRVSCVRAPLGVGLLITPFNGPFAAAARKIFPAIVFGNTAILKAHPDTPYSPVLLAEMLKNAGLPRGVLTVIQGGPPAGQFLVKSRAVDFIGFTGSCDAGKWIKENSSVFRICLEMGGKNPLVVLSDADLERAAKRAAEGAFVEAGQRCAATSRIIVEKNVYEKFKKIFLKRVELAKNGLPPIINSARKNEILAAVKRAMDNGARILAGDLEANSKGYYLPPIVLENVSPDDEISQKEIFGPVVCLYKAKDTADALCLANNSNYALTAAVHTKNAKTAKFFLENLKTGVLRWNGPTHGSEPHMPFAGVKNSGNGWFDAGSQAADFYTQLKQVSIDL